MGRGWRLGQHGGLLVAGDSKMIIQAKFASVCGCGRQIRVGEKVEWSRGAKARHVACAGSAPAAASAPAGKVYDSQKFNGHGARKGGYRKACVSDGNCSSFGSGRSCGGHDCDGH